jgi:hypothetical protein
MTKKVLVKVEMMFSELISQFTNPTQNKIKESPKCIE